MHIQGILPLLYLYSLDASHLAADVGLDQGGGILPICLLPFWRVNLSPPVLHRHFSWHHAPHADENAAVWMGERIA